MKLVRFPYGCAVLGRGWVVRLGRLRVVWAPRPNPRYSHVRWEKRW